MVWRQREEITRLPGIKCMRCLESVKTDAFWNDRQLGQVSYILPKRCNLQFGRKTGRYVQCTSYREMQAHRAHTASAKSLHLFLGDFIISFWQKLSWTTMLRPPHPDLIWIQGQSCNPCHKCTLCTLSPSSLTDWCNLGLVHHLQHHLLQTSVSYNSSPNPWFYFTYLHVGMWIVCVVLVVMLVAFQHIFIIWEIRILFVKKRDQLRVEYNEAVNKSSTGYLILRWISR